MNHQIIQKPLGIKEFHYAQPFKFERDGSINPLVLAYETYGQLSPQKDNAVLIHHALSTDSHVSSHADNPAPGWWEKMVGPGKYIDTERFHVICINNLGSCFGSSGPASLNSQNRPYRLDFPAVSINDMVRSQQLLLECLGIKQLHAVIGNSMGAMLSLAMAILFPQLTQRLISVSSCYRAYPVSIAYHTVQKEIICLDPAWKKGYYLENPVQGLKSARKLGLISYRDANDLNQRFTKEGDIRDYLEYNAGKLANSFDANSYIYLIDAMDDFDVTKDCTDTLEPFRQITAKTLVVSVDSDVLFPPAQQEELYEKLELAKAKATFLPLHSTFGHDAFYADPNIGQHIQQFLNN